MRCGSWKGEYVHFTINSRKNRLGTADWDTGLGVRICKLESTKYIENLGTASIIYRWYGKA